MRKTLIGLTAGIALIFSASAAQAISVSADLPLQYSFSEGGNADKVSGYILRAKLPILVGVGLEQYTATIEEDTANSQPQFDVKFAMVDFFYELPIPVVNVAAGVGLGTATMEEMGTNASSTYESGMAYQYFVVAGFSIFPLVDLHIGYHVTNASVTPEGGGSDFNVGGTMVSFGVRVGI